MKNTAIIIPSRLNAQRLPNKPLALINNKEMILHVYDLAVKARIGEVFVATPDKQIIDLVKAYGGRSIATQEKHQTGTDRINEVFKKELKEDADVIINLPGHRMIVVDSKVSLTAYTEYVNAETESEREKALQRHLTSVRSHLDGLAGKDYPQYKKGESITLETVLMFVPIEPALNLAFDHDPKLFNSAIEKHICVVSPNNLVATLRILAMLWKAEKLNKNRQKLAETAGQMYAKVEGFLSSFEKIEKSNEY